MGRILDLSPDVIFSIISELKTADISTLSTVCKALNALAEPQLYRKISWLEPLHLTPKSFRENAAHLLLRTVLNRPDLGNHIYHFQYIGVKYHTLFSEGDTCFSEQELNLAKKKIMETDFLNSDDTPLALCSKKTWIDAVENGLTSAVLALLLLQLSNLQTLVLDFDQANPDNPYMFSPGPLLPFVGAALLANPHSAQGAFQNLRTADFTARYVYGRDHIKTTLDDSNFVGLFFLPAVRSLTLSYVGREPFQWANKAPVAQSLEKLVFNRSYFNAKSLDAWIHAAPNLAHLACHFIADCNGPYDAWLDCDGLKRILESLRQTLRSLSLSIAYDASTAIDTSLGVDWGTKGRIGSLTQFTRLAYLKVPITMLLGTRAAHSLKLSNVLPQSLVQLCIINDTFYLDTHEWDSHERNKELVDYLKSYRVSTPLLQEFHFSTLEPDEDEYGLIERTCISMNLGFKCIVESNN